MKIYHGSTEKGLDSLKYSEETSRFGGDSNLLYGAAIYMTESLEEAKAYAMNGAVYEVSLVGDILDSTEIAELNQFVQSLNSKLNYDLLTSPLVVDTLELITKGEASGYNLDDALFQCISNDESLYFDIVAGNFEEDSDRVLDVIEEEFSKYQTIAVNRKGVKWFLCKDLTGSCIKIIEEISL